MSDLNVDKCSGFVIVSAVSKLFVIDPVAHTSLRPTSTTSNWLVALLPWAHAGFNLVGDDLEAADVLSQRCTYHLIKDWT